LSVCLTTSASARNARNSSIRFCLLWTMKNAKCCAHTAAARMSSSAGRPSQPSPRKRAPEEAGLGRCTIIGQLTKSSSRHTVGGKAETYFRRRARDGSFHPPTKERSIFMFTRLVELTSKAGKARELSKTINENAVPILKKQRGF